MCAQAGSLMGELVFGYLQHHGHWETAAAVGRDVLGGAVSVSQADIADARRSALAKTRSHHTHVGLLSDQRLLSAFMQIGLNAPSPLAALCLGIDGA